MAVTPVTSFGIEYTFTPKTDFIDLDAVVEAVRRGLDSAHGDGYQLEVPSPVHRNLKSAKKFYDKMMKVLADMPVTPVRIDTLLKKEDYYGTGGGHIHAQISGSREKPGDYSTAYNITTFVYNNPWLNWVFNEFCDDQNANALFSSSGVTRVLKAGPYASRVQILGHTESYPPPMGADRISALRSVIGSKCHSLRVAKPDYAGNYTIEFRFFDAPKSWKQTLEHLDFVMALISYCKKLGAKDKHIKPSMSKPKMQSFHHRGTTQRAFRSAIKMLGLDWRVYKKYMRNFDDRRAFGKMT